MLKQLQKHHKHKKNITEYFLLGYWCVFTKGVVDRRWGIGRKMRLQAGDVVWLRLQRLEAKIRER